MQNGSLYKYFVMVLLIISGCSVSKNSRETNKPYYSNALPNEAIRKLNEFKLLDSAFLKDSRKLRREFFNNWQKYSDSIGEIVCMNDANEVEINKIYETIYKPDTMQMENILQEIEPDSVNIKKEYKDEAMNYMINISPFYRNAHFLVLQETIKYQILPDNFFDNDNKPSIEFIEKVKIKEIKNYKSNIEYYGKPLLRLSEKYALVISEFMKITKSDIPMNDTLGESGLMLKRKWFLAPGIALAPYHSSNKWHIVSFPEIEKIWINSSRTKAFVYYRSSYAEGRKAELEKLKEGLEWQVTSDKRIWIE